MYSAGEIEQRRRELLESAAVPVEQLRRRASEMSLTLEESRLLRELDDLDFLELAA